jgi:hypothetical protein
MIGGVRPMGGQRPGAPLNEISISRDQPAIFSSLRSSSLRNKRILRAGRFIVAGAGLGVAAALSISAPASADPKGEPLPIICDNGTTYCAVDHGHGQFAPVHDVDSNSMLVACSAAAPRAVRPCPGRTQALTAAPQCSMSAGR